MDKTRKMRLAEFKALNPPDSAQRLANYQAEIVDLYLSGYTLKQTHEFLEGQGLNCGYSTLAKWVKANINLKDFRKQKIELVPPSNHSGGQATVLPRPANAGDDGSSDWKLDISIAENTTPVLSNGKAAANTHAETLQERIKHGFGKSPDEIAREVTSRHSVNPKQK